MAILRSVFESAIGVVADAIAKETPPAPVKAPSADKQQPDTELEEVPRRVIKVEWLRELEGLHTAGHTESCHCARCIELRTKLRGNLDSVRLKWDTKQKERDDT